jgi:hypothetical protein
VSTCGRNAAPTPPQRRRNGIAKPTAKRTAKSAGAKPLPEPNLKVIMSDIEIAGTEAIRAPLQPGEHGIRPAPTG